MEKFLTGVKDVDAIVLSHLSDVNLFNISLTSKYGRDLCNYEPFWYGRLKIRFPFFLEVKPENVRDLKNYYVYLIKAVVRILGSFGVRYILDYNISQECLLLSGKRDSILMLASEYGYLEIVKYMMENRANIYTNIDYALTQATINGHLEIVKYLHQKGTDIRDGPLGVAIANGHLEIVKYLVENGVDIRTNNDIYLREASEYGRLEIVKYLHQKGANIHVYYDTPLELASSNGHLEVVKYLVQNGAVIHANGGYPLKWASANGHPEVVKYLIQNGATINGDALEWAIERRKL